MASKKKPEGSRPLKVVKQAEKRLKNRLKDLLKDADTISKKKLKTGLKEAQGSLQEMSLWIHWIC